jgi:hypothetical protein
MVAWIPSPVYNYYVEYRGTAFQDSGVNTFNRSIYLYARSELDVKEILADYKVLTIEKQE